MTWLEQEAHLGIMWLVGTYRRSMFGAALYAKRAELASQGQPNDLEEYFNRCIRPILDAHGNPRPSDAAWSDVQQDVIKLWMSEEYIK